MKKVLLLTSILAATPAIAGPCLDDSYRVAPYVGLEGSFKAWNLGQDNHWTKSRASKVKPYAYAGLKVAPDWAIELGGPIGASKSWLSRKPARVAVKPQAAPANGEPVVEPVAAAPVPVVAQPANGEPVVVGEAAPAAVEPEHVAVAPAPAPAPIVEPVPAVAAVPGDVNAPVATGGALPRHVHRTRSVDLRAIYRAAIDDDTSILAGAGVAHVKMRFEGPGRVFKKQRLQPSAIVGVEHRLTPSIGLRATAAYTANKGMGHAGFKPKGSLSGNVGLVAFF